MNSWDHKLFTFKGIIDVTNNTCLTVYKFCFINLTDDWFKGQTGNKTVISHLINIQKHSSLTPETTGLLPSDCISNYQFSNQANI